MSRLVLPAGVQTPPIDAARREFFKRAARPTGLRAAMAGPMFEHADALDDHADRMGVLPYAVVLRGIAADLRRDAVAV